MLISAVIAFAAATYRPIVYVHRDQTSGTSTLRANGYLLSRGARKPSVFHLRAVCRYDAAAEKWIRQKRRSDRPVTISAKKRAIYGWNTDQVLMQIPSRAGLYWLEWSEDKHVVNGTAVVGPMLCEDIMLGKTPKGMIAACVPSGKRKSATAMFVPDPAVHCRR